MKNLFNELQTAENLARISKNGLKSHTGTYLEKDVNDLIDALELMQSAIKAIKDTIKPLDIHPEVSVLNINMKLINHIREQIKEG